MSRRARLRRAELRTRHDAVVPYWADYLSPGVTPVDCGRDGRSPVGRRWFDAQRYPPPSWMLRMSGGNKSEGSHERELRLLRSFASLRMSRRARLRRAEL